MSSSIKIAVSSIRSYLNRALLFVDKKKIGIHPLFSCILLVEDKLYVNNGETGAILNFPLKVDQPTLFFPFDLAEVVNISKDDAELTLDFDYTAMVCKVKAPNINIKIRLVDPTTFDVPVVPTDLEYIEIEDFYSKITRAMFCCHPDASVNVKTVEGVNVSESGFSSTDTKCIWKEEGVSLKQFVMPKLLLDHVKKLGIEPGKIGINANQIHIVYQDMIMFSHRLAGDDKFPPIERAFTQIRAVEDSVFVEYDKEALKEALDKLFRFANPSEAIKIECKCNVLTIRKMIKESAETEADITMEVNSSGDFADVIVCGQYFMNGVERFISFSIKADNKRLYFQKGQCEYAFGRREM